MPRLLKRSPGTLLAALVMSTIGVPSVHPSLNARAQVSDETLKDHVEYRLQTDPAVKRYDIRVQVANGHVTLTGMVATESQKTEAGKLAKIDGVAKVENDLAVDHAVNDTLADHAKKGLRRTGEAITDAWITTKVKWFYLGDNLLKGSSIDVDTKDRVVTLNGTVKTEAGRARAIALANDTDGVTRVVEKLAIGQ